MTDLVIPALIVVATICGAAGISKLRSRRAFLAFRAGLRQTALIAPRHVQATAFALAAAEVVIAAVAAAALVAGVWLHGAEATTASSLAAGSLAGAAVLTVVLLAGVVLVLRRGTSARCPCFGSSSDAALGKSHAVRNVLLLLVELAGLAGATLGSGSAGLAGTLLAIGPAAVISMVLLRFDDLVSLFADVT